MYAYCDVSTLTANLRLLADFDNEEQYIVVASRALGFMINEYGVLAKCVSRGRERGNGYDVGKCGSETVSKLLDTTL